MCRVVWDIYTYIGYLYSSAFFPCFVLCFVFRYSSAYVILVFDPYWFLHAHLSPLWGMLSLSSYYDEVFIKAAIVYIGYISRLRAHCVWSIMCLHVYLLGSLDILTSSITACAAWSEPLFIVPVQRINDRVQQQWCIFPGAQWIDSIRSNSTSHTLILYQIMHHELGTVAQHLHDRCDCSVEVDIFPPRCRLQLSPWAALAIAPVMHRSVMRWQCRCNSVPLVMS